MNYRHAFHAGNFADVFKHAVLALIIEYLKRKSAPFALMDTHAGLGRYDLAAAEAERTGEWRDGIGRVLESFVGPPTGGTARLPGLASLFKAIAAVNGGKKPSAENPPRWYPGSPRVARALMRKSDRLRCAELHPEDARALAGLFGGDAQVLVRHMDGYEAIRAWLPPPERRGVVLIDPPFEQRDEFKLLLKGLGDGHRRFATGTFVLWHPIKDRAPVEAFHQALVGSGIKRILAAELLLRPPGGARRPNKKLGAENAAGSLGIGAFAPGDPERLNGCGLIVVNPPWRLDQDLAELVAGLRAILGGLDEGANRREKTAAVRWLVGE
ncbi:MAG: 23S rRNA (adenine(2030)-N(6))-methyltransferase RlmJ [Rhodospirillales bacterium]|nr:23S rRNA (adenine(2030)-N(6))-methyltransferase RlmJ [Rhodospirillales bacterium]MSP80819.1 23S rRNA (adenine(2030)-N(6))-methyltransferase RlmJ [Rhodospirillales bacterium]